MNEPGKPLELLEGHPFDHLIDDDERARIDRRVNELLAADAGIKAVRSAAGFAQRAVADSMGVSASSIAQLERRDLAAVQVGTLTRYFAALGYRLRIELDPFDS